MATLGLKVVDGGHLTATRKRNVLAVLNHPEFGPQLVAGIPIRETPKWRAHNLVAHPLLIVWPRLGVWLHDRTAPTGSETQTG